MKDTGTILLELPEHTTPLYPITHRIVAEVDRVIADRITTCRESAPPDGLIVVSELMGDLHSLLRSGLRPIEAGPGTPCG